MPERLRYADHPDGFCDVYGEDGRPAALVVHGGFWRERYDLSLMDGLCEDLADRGWRAWNVEYRRLGRGEARWPQIAADVRAAAQLAAATDDARPRVAIGHSAGGQLALWLGGRGSPAPVVAQAPVSDLAAAVTLSDGVVAELRAPESASPIARVPLGVRQLVVHGADDDIVPVAMSRAYVRAARAAGDDVDYEERSDEGHFEHISPQEGAWRAVADWLEGLR